jgi:hypothetical protein
MRIFSTTNATTNDRGNRSGLVRRSALSALFLALSLSAAACMTAEDPGIPMHLRGIENPAPPALAAGGDSGSSDGSSPAPPSTIQPPGEATEAGAKGEVDASDGVNDTAVLARIADGRFRTSHSFTQVTRAPYPSAVAAGSTISEWVSTSAVAPYDAISPGVTGSGETVPVGTSIVRAVLGADGAVTELTLMFKGPPGYNPDLGDWWFAVTDPNGVVAVTDAGPQVGRLPQCYGCHIPRANDGYLFGVPLADRSDGGPP